MLTSSPDVHVIVCTGHSGKTEHLETEISFKSETIILHTWSTFY